MKRWANGGVGSSYTSYQSCLWITQETQHQGHQRWTRLTQGPCRAEAMKCVTEISSLPQTQNLRPQNSPTSGTFPSFPFRGIRLEAKRWLGMWGSINLQPGSPGVPRASTWLYFSPIVNKAARKGNQFFSAQSLCLGTGGWRDWHEGSEVGVGSF